MAAVCGRLEKRGHPLAVVVTRSVKSAALGRKGVFRSSRLSSSDWSGRLPAWAKAGLRRQPHASQRGVLVSFISQGESGDCCSLLADDRVAVDREAGNLSERCIHRASGAGWNFESKAVAQADGVGAIGPGEHVVRPYALGFGIWDLRLVWIARHQAYAFFAQAECA